MADLGSYIFKLGIDDSEYNKGMVSADTKMKKFGETTTKVGKSLTKNITLPIAGLAAVSIKLAGDFEVASNKFAGAFVGVEAAAGDAVNTLNEMGIASSQATQLLAFTGDLLKGFGATSDQALELAEATNKVAVALAAYNGVPVQQASEAATKALLGETESLKSLSVVIRQSDVDARLAAEGMGDLTGQARLLAKAQVTLKLITEQSGDAIGNFSDNTDSLNFKLAALIADLKDLAVQFGTILLPIVKDFIDQASTFVEWMSAMDESTSLFIIQLAAMAAAAGPVVLAIGSISTALAVLAANPVTIAIAGIIALTGVVVALGAKVKRDKISALAETFGELAENTGVAEDKMDDFLKTAEVIEGFFVREQWNSSMEETAAWIQMIAMDSELTKEQIIGIGIASENVGDQFKEQLQTIQEQEDTQTELLRAELDKAVVISGQVDMAEEITKSTEEKAAAEIIATAELEKQAAIRAKIEDNYQQTLTLAEGIIDADKTDIENIEEKLAQLEKYVGGTIYYEEQRVEAIRILELERTAILWEETKKRLDIEEEAADKAVDYQEKVLANVAAIIRKIRAAQSKAAQETYENWELAGDMIEESFDAIDDIINLSAENWQETFDKSADAFLDAAKKSGNVYVLAAAIAVKAISSIIKAIKSVNDAEEARKELVAGVESEIQEIRFQALAEEIEREYELEVQSINDLEQQRIDAYLATLSAKEVAALKSAGIIEETELERIAREKDAAIAAGDAETVALLEREAEIEKIRAEADAAQEQAEKDYLNRKAQYEYDYAVSQKKTKLIEVKAAGQEALAGLKWWQWLAGWDDDVRDVYGKLYSTVSSLTIPEPVFLAKGGVVNNPGDGVNAVVGEAGPEAVMPLNDKFFSMFRDKVFGSSLGDVNSSESGSSPVIIQNIMDGKMVSQSVVGYINNNTPGTQIRNTAIVNR